MATKTKSKAETEQAVRMEIEDGIAIVTLDLPGKPVNVLNTQMIEEITDILVQLETGGGGARAAVILSGKPGNWTDGFTENFGAAHRVSIQGCILAARMGTRAADGV